MPICHSIVTAAGGDIDIQESIHGGTLVRVSLPAVVVPTNDRSAAGAAHRTPPDPDRRRILVVDDEEAIGTCIRRLLRARHDVDVVDSGEGALTQLLSDASYDVILCDLMMPRMGGMDLYHRLMTEAPERAGRFIFMTGGAFSERASAFLATCKQPVLEKPIDFAELGRLVMAISTPPAPGGLVSHATLPGGDGLDSTPG